MREEILDQIRQLATANGGKPPGLGTFVRETGIRRASFLGVYWARWGDAVAEAGLERNVAAAKQDEEVLLGKFADLCRQLGKAPTAMEIRLHRRINPDYPGLEAAYRNFQSISNMHHRLAQWASAKESYADVAAILAGVVSPEREKPTSTKEGMVYLIRSGPHYKIGRSNELERRVKQIRVALPDAATLIHSIRTDDPAGIEAYWHRRFADRRANGEWFKLLSADVAAFKRRKFQ